MSFTVIKKRPARKTPERDLQRAVKAYLDMALPRESVWAAVPNGGQRNAIEAAKMKGDGVLPGFPDILVLWNGKAFCLELKSETGRLSPEQRTVHARLQDAKVPTETIRSVEEARDRLHEWGLPMRPVRVA